MTDPTNQAGGVVEPDDERSVLRGVVELAKAAHAHWDADREAKVGKILLALAGWNEGYDRRADALHAALATKPAAPAEVVAPEARSTKYEITGVLVDELTPEPAEDLKLSKVAAMPSTEARRPQNEDEPGGYLESDRSWCDNNPDTLKWFIDNYEAIRATLAKSAVIENLIAQIRAAKSMARRDYIFDEIISVWEDPPPPAAPAATEAPSTPAQAPSTGAEAFKQYLKECDEFAIQPDAAGAFHWAWTNRFAPPVVQPASPAVEAFRALLRAEVDATIDVSGDVARQEAQIDEADHLLVKFNELFAPWEPVSPAVEVASKFVPGEGHAHGCSSHFHAHAKCDCGYEGSALRTPPAPAAVTEGASEQLYRRVVTYEGFGVTGVAFEPVAAPHPAVAVPGSLTAEQVARLLSQFEVASVRCAQMHREHLGKAMSDQTYNAFATLRDDTIPALRKRLIAALATTSTAAQPEGFKQVPTEPTPAMRKAAADAWLDSKGGLILNRAAAALRAGIDAAPSEGAK